MINESTLGDMADPDESLPRNLSRDKLNRSKSGRSSENEQLVVTEPNIVFMHLEEQNNEFKNKIPVELV